MRYLLALLLGFGVLWKTIYCADGVFQLYRQPNLCELVFNGELVQVVDRDMCAGRVPT